LVWGLVRGPGWALWIALAAMTAVLVLFLGPVGTALIRAPSRTDTVWGMRLALLALLGVASLGLILTIGIVLNLASCLVLLPILLKMFDLQDFQKTGS